VKAKEARKAPAQKAVKRSNSPSKLTATQRGYLAGQRWIETEGAADCTDKEMLEEARVLAGWEAPEGVDAFVNGFLSGVSSMLVPT
jgi:hypothetical protein